MSKERVIQEIQEIQEKALAKLNKLPLQQLKLINDKLIGYIDNISTDTSSKGTDDDSYEKNSLLEINSVIEELDNKNYKVFEKLIAKLHIEDFYKVNEWGESIIGNIISSSDFSALEIINRYFENSYNSNGNLDVTLLDELNFVAVEGGICGTDFSKEVVCNILGNIFDQDSITNTFYGETH